MAKFGIKTKRGNEPTWQTFLDEGDGDPIRFLVADWTRTAQEKVTDLLKDRDHVKGLGIRWNDEYLDPETGEKSRCWMLGDRAFPYGSGDRKQELRSIITVDYLVRDWSDNVVGEDGKTKLECDIVNKAWLFERQDLGLWLFQRGQEGGAKVIEADAKN